MERDVYEVFLWLGGFVAAYLLLKALRSFGTRNMAVAGMFLLVSQVEARNFGVNYAVTGTGATDWRIGLYNPTTTSVFVIHSGNGAGTGCVNCDYIINYNEASYSQLVFYTLSGSANIVPVNYPAQNTTIDLALNLQGGTGQSGTVTFTNSFNNGSITNTNSISGDYLFITYTNGVVQTSNWVKLNPNDTFDWNVTNSNAEVTVEVIGPGGPENDYQPGVISTGTGGSNTGSVNNTGGGGTATNNDPFGSLPTRTTTTNITAEARKDAEGIIKAIGAGNNEVTALLRQIATNGSGAAMDLGWTNILQQIATNTLQANLSKNELLRGLTNVPATNLITEMFNAMTNWAGTNYNQSAFKSGLGGLTNGFEGTFTNISVSDGSALSVNLGRGFHLNLNPIKQLTGEQTENFNGLRDAASSLGTFIKYWLEWAIYFCAFWICFQRTWDHAKELLPSAFLIGNIAWSWSDLFAIAAAPFTLGLTALWPVVKRAGSVIAVTLIATVVALLPLLAWIVITNMGFSGVFFPSISEVLSGAGVGGHASMTAVALEFLYVISFYFPLVTFAIAAVNVFGFRFYLVGLTMLTWTMLKGMYQVSTANQLNSDGSDRVEQLDEGYIDV